MDRRMANYPLLSNPWGGLFIITLYLLFVLKLGPKWMKDKKPYNLKSVISIYNVCQVIFNLYILYLCRFYLMRKDYNILCQPINSPDDQHPYTLSVLHATYLYYLTKYADLFDTIFFVLRKKTTQLSFLHIYHHSLIIVGVYYAIRHYAGSHITVLGLVNAFVHVIMYSYYFLTTYKPGLSNVWWKKYLTVLQILQFVILFIHFSFPLFVKDCNIPRAVSFIAMTQTAFMAVLFSDFYVKAYLWPKKKKKRYLLLYVYRILYLIRSSDFKHDLKRFLSN